MEYLIYAVDDEESIRSLYTCALSNSEFKVKTFENAESFYSELNIKAPDLIMLDVMLDDIDGLEILKKIRSNIIYIDIPIIMVSAKTQEIDKVIGLNLGADDYISKPFGIAELIARIKSKLRKKKDLNKIEYNGLFLDDIKHTFSVDGKEITLTVKEYEIIKLFMMNIGKVIKRDEFFMKIWGDEVITETRMLDFHIKELRKKLASSSINIDTVRGVGFILK